MFSRLPLLLTLILILNISVCAFAKEQSLFKEQAKEYSDKAAKFRIWLPDGWQMVSRQDEPSIITVGFSNPQEKDSSLISVGWSVMTDAEGILEYYTMSYLRTLRDKTSNFTSADIENMKLNGMNCIKTIADYEVRTLNPENDNEKIDSFKSILYFLRKYGYYFVIRTVTPKDKFDQDKNLLENILATFELTE